MDATDQEIIKDLFQRASGITVYYHSSQAKKEYIFNLVSIFGKDGLEEMIRDKELRFKDIKELDKSKRKTHTMKIKTPDRKCEN